MAKQLFALTFLVGVLGASCANAAQINNIDSLPDKGTVSLEAIVDSVDGQRSLTVRDEMGNTIDVKTLSNLSVKEGDRVAVNGTVESDFAGIGHEIASATVNKLASADTGSANRSSAPSATSNVPGSKEDKRGSTNNKPEDASRY